MQPSTRQRPPLFLLAVLCVFGTAGCARLPDTEAIIARHTQQAAQFETASGPVSAKKSAAILAELKRTSGDTNILDKQIALEQALTTARWCWATRSPCCKTARPPMQPC